MESEKVQIVLGEVQPKPALPCPLESSFSSLHLLETPERDFRLAKPPQDLARRRRARWRRRSPLACMPRAKSNRGSAGIARASGLAGPWALESEMWGCGRHPGMLGDKGRCSGFRPPALQPCLGCWAASFTLVKFSFCSPFPLGVPATKEAGSPQLRPGEVTALGRMDPQLPPARLRGLFAGGGQEGVKSTPSPLPPLPRGQSRALDCGRRPPLPS
ncbi:uncharacterized protein LOC131506848 isoform X1 [Neofelis nebulosa]|uniref:uncharacterized protein LOC131506848 isoform X1 n=1 Tax=Neofelis nebulosa TaxID=61452 RepID=UPI00272AA2D8|nr:uncharacterized protein LOC131506848 isoform X1 [Neofelis nebulosa]